MKKHSKRFLLLQQLILNKEYSIKDGIKLLKTLSNTNFIETAEAHINLDINYLDIKNQVTSNIILPNSLNKKLKIAIFDNEINFNEYKDLGAYKIGLDTIIYDIKNNLIDFDILITTPLNMPKLIKLNNYLKSKNLVPSLKNGTITNNIKNTLLEFQKGKIEFKSDKYGNIHLLFGKLNFEDNKLEENLYSIYLNIKKYNVNNNKKSIFKFFYICTTMSPSIKLNLNSFN